MAQRRRAKSLGWVLGAVVALTATGAPAAPSFTPATAAVIERAAQDQVRAGKTVGVTIEVVQAGRVVFTGAYGKADLEWNTPMTQDSVFRVASVTKQFTAAAILVLVDQGKLSLDDKLSKFLPRFPRGNEVTIEHLLKHRAGMISFEAAYPRKEEFFIPKSTDEMVDLIAGLDPLYEFTPGSDTKYSSSDYYLLGAVIEKVTGRSIDDFMQANLFAPAGMTHTAMDRAEDLVPHRAAGYDLVGGVAGAFQNAPYYPYTLPGAAGGLRSTVGDLTKWRLALLGGEIISAPLLARMTSLPDAPDGRVSSAPDWRSGGGAPPSDDYGYGVHIENVQGHKDIWHSGHIWGFNAELHTFPKDQVTIAMLSNTSDGLLGLLEVVQAAVLNLPAPKPRP